MGTYLIGGGWTPSARDTVYGAFLDEAGRGARVACVVVDEGDGAAQAERWTTALRATRPCEPVPVLVRLGDVLDPGDLDGADALLVCGGLTPAYADALAPVAGAVRDWLGAGRPYAGFSAGAAVAAGSALVGGWRADGVVVCSEDAGEDLDEVTVAPGLGLVPFAVDVHAAQWGTLSRLVAAVSAGAVADGVAVDEDTVLVADGDGFVVRGLGRAHRVRGTAEGVLVRSSGAGERLG
ncbi:type 1 glutamine amidotransferase family protein [Thalassiella azotivora]